jgi:hypothetical protein
MESSFTIIGSCSISSSLAVPITTRDEDALLVEDKLSARDLAKISHPLSIVNPI